jgi:hypothetical protein
MAGAGRDDDVDVVPLATLAARLRLARHWAAGCPAWPIVTTASGRFAFHGGAAGLQLELRVFAAVLVVFVLVDGAFDHALVLRNVAMDAHAAHLGFVCGVTLPAEGGMCLGH